MRSEPFWPVWLAVALCANQATNAQSWQWAVQMAGPETEEWTHACMDNAGNTYTAFNSASDICTIGGVPFAEEGVNWLTKLNSNGDVIWVVPLDAFVYRLAYDPTTNSVYAAGTYAYSVDWGCGSITNHGETDGFVARLDTAGNCQWVKGFGYSGAEKLYAMAVNDNGEVILNVGAYGGAIFDDTLFVNHGSILVKYASDGTLLWATRKCDVSSGAMDYEVLFFDMVCRGEYTYAIGGCSVDTIVIDGVLFDSENGGNRMCLAQIDSEGTIRWMKPMAWTTNSLGIGAICMDSAGGIYVGGYFYEKAIFDEDTLFAVHPDFQFNDMFLAKYDTSGIVQWARQAEATDRCQIRDVSISSEDELYVTGWFKDTITLAGQHAYQPDIGLFVARYDTSGTCLGMAHAANGVGQCVEVAPDGSVVVVGYFTNALSLLPLAPQISAGMEDVFVAKTQPFTGVSTIEWPRYDYMHIYANPSYGLCTVNLPESLRSTSNLVLSVFDQTGRVVRSIPVQFTNEGTTLDLRAQAKGLYHVELGDGRQRYAGTIVIE
jgi:hypothetical protein